MDYLGNAYTRLWMRGCEMQLGIISPIFGHTKLTYDVINISSFVFTILATTGLSTKYQQWARNQRSSKYGNLLDYSTYGFPLVAAMIGFPLGCWWPVLVSSVSIRTIGRYYLDKCSQ